MYKHINTWIIKHQKSVYEMSIANAYDFITPVLSYVYYKYTYRVLHVSRISVVCFLVHKISKVQRLTLK